MFHAYRFFGSDCTDSHAFLSLYSTHMHIAHFVCYDFLLDFYCGSIIMLLAQVYARVCMCVLKSIIKVLAISKTLPSNIITFFNLIELNSTFRIKFSYCRGHIVVVLRAGWDSIRTTLSWQSVCFKGNCLPYTAKCNSGIIVSLVGNAHAYCIALCLFDIFFITDRQRFIKKTHTVHPSLS